jgi:hypothetical protein
MVKYSKTNLHKNTRKSGNETIFSEAEQPNCLETGMFIIIITIIIIIIILIFSSIL